MIPPNTNPTQQTLLYIALVINIGAMMTNFRWCKAHSDSNNVCITPVCNLTASQIIDDMDTNVNPCENFYKFVCGNFIQMTSIPEDENSVNAFSEINNEVHERIRGSIEEQLKSDEPKHITLVKNFYKSCMNEQSIEQQSIEHFLGLVNELGGWPVLQGDSWNEKNFHWIESVYKFRDKGLSLDYFIEFSVSPHLMNSSKRGLRIDQPSLGLSREFLLGGMNEDLVNAYRKYMIDIAVLLGASEERAEKEYSESLEFEIALANISLPSSKRRNITLLHNPLTIKEMSQKFPSIPWKESFNRLLAPKIMVDDDELVNVVVPSYISDFERLINTTSRRTQANYAMWRNAMASAFFLNKAMRQVQLKYTSKLKGIAKSEPRWRECVDIASKKLSLSMGSMYVKKYFNTDDRKHVAEIVEDIMNQFNEILKTVDWMDEDTRKSALEKAVIMAKYVAYPDEILDDEKLNEYYSDLELSGGNYLESMMNLSLFRMKSSFGELRDPVDKSDWKTHGRAINANAFYAPFENSIQIPAALLQKRVFNNDRPKYMNYGALGFVIGHEMTHGFDDIGRQHDKDGNLIDWWAPSTKTEYLRKAQCIISQYSNYTESQVGLKLNGINTQGENIADNGGIKTAYSAYKKWVLRNGVESRLPGLDYTPSQLFWISAANMWCTKKRPEAAKSYATTGVHSPPEFRVIGPLSNMIDFANDFKCAEGSKMNPKKKCAVW